MTTHHPLHELALKLVRTINLSERELIEVIGRMDREKVYRLFGYPSLFQGCYSPRRAQYRACKKDLLRD